jgi:D-tyrosyl-tRNA(Tyr) deacylase
LQVADPARDCGRAQQLFLPEMPAVPARVRDVAIVAARRKKEKGNAETQKAPRNRREIREIRVRAVLQRVSRAKVIVEGRVTGEIGAGLMILLGVGREDTSAVATSLAEKCANLRIFEDDEGKMNRSLLDVKGSTLVVSQFTLYGDARGQRRPSFITAAPPELAKSLYDEFCEALRKLGVTVATGIFQAMMSVELVNEGPVTILLDSDKTF